MERDENNGDEQNRRNGRKGEGQEGLLSAPKADVTHRGVVHVGAGVEQKPRGFNGLWILSCAHERGVAPLVHAVHDRSGIQQRLHALYEAGLCRNT